MPFAIALNQNAGATPASKDNTKILLIYSNDV